MSINSKRNKNDNIHKNEVKKSDDQTNIDKYRVAADITEYHTIQKLIYLRIIIKIYGDKAIISCKTFM